MQPWKHRLTSWEYIQLLAWQSVPRSDVRLEVLRNDLLRDVGQPIGQQERGAFVEIAAIEYQQELNAVGIVTSRL